MFLFAPTVPSEPRPKKTARTVPAWLHLQRRVIRQAGPGHVVVDADGEPAPGPACRQFREDAGHHAGGELLGGQAIPAADDHRHQLPVPTGVSLRQGGGHIQEQRLTGRARFLGPVQHGDPAGGRGQGRQQCLHRERPVQPDLQHPDPLAGRAQMGGGLPGRLPGRAHHHDHPVRRRVAVVLHDAVVAAGPLPERRHRVLHGTGHGGVERVHGLAGLEVGVGILRRAADEGVLGRQRPPPVRPDRLVADQRPQIVIGQQIDRVQLVRGAEPVEEVHERHPGGQGRRLRHQRQIVRLLYRGRGQQGEPGLPDRHHIRVVTEDGQPLRRQRAGGDVHDRRGQLTSDLVHVRDHQQQALGGGEGGGQRAALERAVQCPRRARLALHFHHRRHRPPQVRPVLAGPLVRQFGHRRRRGDRVDAADLVEPVGDRDRRLVAVDGGAHQPSSGTISMACTGHCS